MLQKYLSDCEVYDGTESVCSDETVASEKAERDLAFYNEVLGEEQNGNGGTQIVNLQIVEAVNVYGENEGEKRDVIPLKAIGDIINQNNRTEETQVLWKSIRRNNWIFGSMITIMTGIIFVSFIGIWWKTWEKPEVSEMSQLPSFVAKNKWINDAGRVASKRLNTPVTKVIIFDTVVEEACEKEGCFYQEDFYPKFEDIKENFIISTKGVILEGRGYSRESDIQLDFEIDSDAISEKLN
jgi:hypothetical protein